LGFKSGDIVTKIPVCGHKFHYECVKVWLEFKTTCPCCRSIIRKNLIEHFHGPFEISNMEKLKKISEKESVNDFELNEISLNISECRMDSNLVNNAEKL